MKKILLAQIFLFLAVMPGLGQAIEKFHDAFSGDSHFMCISIESGLLKMFKNMETGDEEPDEFLRAMAGIEKINVYRINREESSFDDTAYRRFRKDVEKDKFEELMTVRDGSTHLDFMVRESKGKISDLIMMVDETEEFVLVTLSGDIDLATIAKLSDGLDIDGTEHLKKIDKKN